MEKRTKPSLSIVNPLDVLRSRLVYSFLIAYFREKKLLLKFSIFLFSLPVKEFLDQNVAFNVNLLFLHFLLV